MNEEVKSVLIQGSMVSFRSECELSSYLVRAKQDSLHCKAEFRKYGKNHCEIYDYVTDTDTFTNTEIGESFKINRQLNCDD